MRELIIQHVSNMFSAVSFVCITFAVRGLETMPCLSDNVASSKSGPLCISTTLVGPLKSEDKWEAHPGRVIEQCNNTEGTRLKGEDVA